MWRPREGARSAFCLALAAWSFAAWSDELFRRAQILEERFGRVELRSAYGVRLSTPVECASGESGCVEPRVYDEVSTLDFVLEHRTLAQDEVVRTEEPRGTIHLALSLRPGDLESFREELRDALSRLAAQAFVKPFAGFTAGQAPFDTQLALRSQHPIWICFESDGSKTARLQRRVERDTEGNESVSVLIESGFHPQPRLCDEMRESTKGAYPETLLTLSAPTHLTESAVTFDDIVAIDTVDAAALAARPSEIRFFKRRAQSSGRSTATATGALDGFALGQWMAGGWRFDAFAKPASIPLAPLDRNAWLQRWMIETVDRRLGIHPTERVASRRVVHVAYLPTDPPSPIEGEAAVTGASTSVGQVPEEQGRPPATAPAAIDRTAFLDEVSRRLDESDSDPGDLLEELLKSPAAGLQSEGWLAVLCPGDGKASYTLPPTRAEQPVTNADLFCAALESRLDRGVSSIP